MVTSSELTIIIIPPLCAGIGYLGKALVDKIVKARQSKKERKLKSIESKLKNFFYPFHSNLKRENLIFQRILSFFCKDKLDNNSHETLYNKIFWGLDTEILQIHNDNQELIKNNFVEMHFSDELAKVIMSYDEHVSIYRILRSVITERPNDMSKVLWPGNFGSVYPTNMLEMIENEMIYLQNQQTYILQGHSVDNMTNYLQQFQYRKSPSNTTIEYKMADANNQV